MGHPLDVERATELHIEWCTDLARRAGLLTTHQAGPQMRAVMLELRECLEPASVVAIANVLPALERGIFLTDWSLDYVPKTVPDAHSFFQRVYDRVKAHHFPQESLISDVFALLQAKLDPARAKVIRDRLPTALLSCWPE